MRERGFVLYEGPSLLDGSPIVVIATMKTNNVKTGDMVQTWILRSDIEPHLAVKTGDDSSVCGDCIHRPANQGSCYVTVFQAPLGVYRAYHRGSYSHDIEQLKVILAGRKLRIGAYGDPAAAPYSVWAPLVDCADGHTGYTHQWERSDFDSRILDLVMASADTQAQAAKLKLQGKRYFRVKRDTDSAIHGEVECLSDSIGKSCEECLLCDGSARGKGKSVYINVHGSKAKNFNPNLIAVA